MAEKKLAVIAERTSTDFILEVYCDGTQEQVEIIEGVEWATVVHKGHFFVGVDRRYNLEDVRQEILAKFQPSIPDVFTEEEKE